MNPFTIARVVSLMIGVLLLMGAFLPLAEFAGSISGEDVVIKPNFVAAKGTVGGSPISRLDIPVEIVNNSTSPLTRFTIAIRLGVGGKILELKSSVEDVAPGEAKNITCSVEVSRSVLARLLSHGISIEGVYLSRRGKFSSIEILTVQANRTLLMPMLNLTFTNRILYFHYVNPTPIAVECSIHYKVVYANGTLYEGWTETTIRRYMETYVPLAYGDVESASVELVVGGETLYTLRWEGGF